MDIFFEFQLENREKTDKWQAQTAVFYQPTRAVLTALSEQNEASGFEKLDLR